MPDQGDLTPEELARLNAAYHDGAYWMKDNVVDDQYTPTNAEVKARADTVYPIRKLREVRDHYAGNIFWRCENDQIQWYMLNDERKWIPLSERVWTVSPERIRIWADLLDNPWE